MAGRPAYIARELAKTACPSQKPGAACKLWLLLLSVVLGAGWLAGQWLEFGLLAVGLSEHLGLAAVYVGAGSVLNAK